MSDKTGTPRIVIVTPADLTGLTAAANEPNPLDRICDGYDTNHVFNLRVTADGALLGDTHDINAIGCPIETVRFVVLA